MTRLLLNVALPLTLTIGIGPLPLCAPTHHGSCVDYRPALKHRLALTLTTLEGGSKSDTLCGRQNNPGCLSYASQRHARRGDQGYAAFDDLSAGWTALVHHVDRLALLPLEDAIRLHLGHESNRYLQSVQTALGNVGRRFVIAEASTCGGK